LLLGHLALAARMRILFTVLDSKSNPHRLAVIGAGALILVLIVILLTVTMWLR
jgi:hypothetical protein